jgi:hypothetical protein
MASMKIKPDAPTTKTTFIKKLLSKDVIKSMSKLL